MAQSGRRNTKGTCNWSRMGRLWILLLPLIAADAWAQVPIEGFIPFVGFGLTDQYETLDDEILFFVADAQEQVGGNPLGTNGTPYYDIGLFDTGAATHILTAAADAGFDIGGNGFSGAYTQVIGGATGTQLTDINDPLGIYVAGMGDRVTGGTGFAIDSGALRGQSNVATLTAHDDWALPNIIGLPIAAQHGVHIQNSDPQIFQMNGRTVRTPQIDFHPLGEGGRGILRRASMSLNPGASFTTGPIYVYDTNIDPTNPEIAFHDDPVSPTIVQNGGLFLDVDLTRGSGSIQDEPFLFDTGASLTVISTNTAVLMGIDPILDAPDFRLAVEGSGGVSAGIPGYIADSLTLNTAGGTFTVSDVPVAVLDVTDPTNVGNIIPGILGMNIFADRDLVIDANASVGAGGNPPALYISDPVTSDCNWSDPSASGSWIVGGNWSGAVAPDVLCKANVVNVSGADQEAVLGASDSSTAYRAVIEGAASAEMAVVVETGSTLTTYADVVIREGGRLHLSGGKVDAQFLQMDGGSLTGSGEIFAGTGPVSATVRNAAGVVAPGDSVGSSQSSAIGHIDVTVGDFGNEALMEFDLGGTASGQFDSLSAERNIYLEGTLAIDLVDLGMGVFAPEVGDMFNILTAGGHVIGTFDSVSLPEGYDWSVNYLDDAVQLEVVGSGGNLACDADGDGDCQLDDLDALYAAIGTSESQFDLDSNGTVGDSDITRWLELASSPENSGKLDPDDVYRPGDTDLDGSVDSQDLGRLLNNFGSTMSGLKWAQGNLNGDAFVDSVDLGRLLNEFGATSAASTAAVPEPDGFVLLLVGLGMVCRRSRRL